MEKWFCSTCFSSSYFRILIGNLIIISLLECPVTCRNVSNGTNMVNTDLYNFTTPTDMVVVMDQSGSLWNKVEKYMKPYLIDLMKYYFVVHEYYTRIAIVQAREATEVVFDTISKDDPGVSVCSLLESDYIKNLKSNNSDAHVELTESLKRSREIFKKGCEKRPDVKRQILWLMTDADFEIENEHKEDTRLKIQNQTDELKQEGVEIFGIGIKGFVYNADNMSSLVSDGEGYHICPGCWEEFTDKLTNKSDLPKLTPAALSRTNDTSCGGKCQNRCYCDVISTGEYCKAPPVDDEDFIDDEDLIISLSIVGGLILVVFFITCLVCLKKRKTLQVQADQGTVDRQNTVSTQTSPNDTGMAFGNQTLGASRDDQGYMLPVNRKQGQQYLRINPQNYQNIGLWGPKLVHSRSSQNIQVIRQVEADQGNVYENITVKNSYVNETVLKKLRKGATNIRTIFPESEEDRTQNCNDLGLGTRDSNRPSSNRPSTSGAQSKSKVSGLVKMFDRFNGKKSVRKKSDLKHSRKHSEPNEYSLQG